MASPTLEIIVKAKDEASGTLKGITESWGGVTSAFQTVGTVALGAAVGGIAALAGATAAGVSLAMEQERVEAQLAAVLESTGHAAGLTADQIKNMASELQGVTTFGDEAILSGQNMLLTFTQIGEDVFPAATEAMLNISTAMGTSVEGAAIQVGKALNDPISGLTSLTRVGIQFTDEQREMIAAMVEAGDVAGAQGVILAELETQFGGSARAAAETFGGRMQQLKNIIGDAGEQLGFAFLPVLTTLAENAMPLVTAAMETLQPLLDQFSEWLTAGISLLMNMESPLDLLNEELRAMYDSVAAVVEPIIQFITENVKLQDILIVLGIAIASVVIPALISMVVAAAPVIAVIVAAIAIVALMRTAWENDWGGIQGKVAAVTDWLKTTIETVMTGIRTFWEENGQQILEVAQRIWSLIQETIENYLTYIRSVFDLFAALFRGDWEEFGAKLVEVWQNAWILVRDFLAGFWDLIKPVLENLWTAIRDWWNGIDWASLGRSIIDGIVSAITGGAGRITGAISGIISGIQGAIGGVIPGFQTGGFTGFMPENAIAGFVHGNEYVFSAPAVRRIGLSNLEAMHRGQAVGGGNITFTSGSIAVYAAPGMDERRLADKVIDAVNRKLGSQADSRMR